MNITRNINVQNHQELVDNCSANQTISSKISSITLTPNIVIFGVLESWAESDNTILDTIIQNLTGQNPKFDLALIYSKRKADGWDFYNRIRSNYVYLINIGQATGDDEYFIQNKMKDVKANLLSGDWVTAKKDLINVSVEGAFTEQIKTSFLTQIQSYIEANYPQTSW
jgi:hypothetical protein